MLGQRPLLGALFLFAGLWALLCDAVPTSVKYVYLADTRAHSEIQAKGGFTVKGQSVPGSISQDVSPWNYVKGDSKGFSKQNDGYVFTSWVGTMQLLMAGSSLCLMAKAISIRSLLPLT